jgi:hypothetical protein
MNVTLEDRVKPQSNAPRPTAAPDAPAPAGKRAYHPPAVNVLGTVAEMTLIGAPPGPDGLSQSSGT